MERSITIDHKQVAERFVGYVQEHNIVVCRVYQYAVPPAKIAAHFRDDVHRCSREQIRAIQE
jgi:hypothetical protein